jgi:hypothetical protein
MRFFGMVMLSLWIAPCAAVYGASAELRLPVLHAGNKTFSNAVVTASSKDRIVVQHDGGLTSVKLSELDAETVRDLHHADVISGNMAREILRHAPKPETVKVQSGTSAEAAAGTDRARGLIKKGSVAAVLSDRFEKEARERGAHMDPQAVAYSIPSISRWLMSALCIVTWLYRRWLYYRIVEISTGHGTLLVFLPVFQAIPLMNAARLSLQWLLVPLFAVVGLFLPPALGNMPSVVLGYYALVGLLWLATGILYLVWCVRLCRAVDCTGWLALLLIWPVLDWIALFILSRSEGKPQAQPPVPPSPDEPKRLVLAI